MCIHCRQILHLFVWAYKRVIGELFLPVSKQMQVNSIYTDTIRILWYHAMSKIPNQLSDNSRNKCRSNRYQFSVKSALILLLWPSLYMNQETEKLYFVQLPYITKSYPVNAIFLFKQNKCRINVLILPWGLLNIKHNGYDILPSLWFLM